MITSTVQCFDHSTSIGYFDTNLFINTQQQIYDVNIHKLLTTISDYMFRIRIMQYSYA